MTPQKHLWHFTKTLPLCSSQEEVKEIPTKKRKTKETEFKEKNDQKKNLFEELEAMILKPEFCVVRSWPWTVERFTAYGKIFAHANNRLSVLKGM